VVKPALVSKAGSLTKAVNLINGLKGVKKNHSVLIKPNINSDDFYPGTTHPDRLRELIKLLRTKTNNITVGDMSSAFWGHTRLCSDSVGITRVCEKEGVPLLFFDNHKWVKVSLPGTSLKSAYYSERLCDYDHLINFCVMKTHRQADFTLSLKNLMGCIHPRTRLRMHTHLLKERIAEFNLALNPLINIVDGTQCFIDGGPDKGDLRDSSVVLASRDRVALDVTCIKLLKSLGSKTLKSVDPWDHPQISAAVRLGLGVSGDKDIKIIKES